eukprot:524169_1
MFFLKTTWKLMVSLISIIYLISGLLARKIDSTTYSSPIRTWQQGYFRGDPIYTPVGVVKNYTMVFRSTPDSLPADFVMIETDDEFTQSFIPGSYQQWTMLSNEITYCGLLTQDQGKTYTIETPRFYYQQQLSSEYEVIFCGDPRAGGCDTFFWIWKFDNSTNQLLNNNTVGGIPHQLTYMDLIESIDPDKVPIQTDHRQLCTYSLGNENPINYEWLQKPNANN